MAGQVADIRSLAKIDSLADGIGALYFQWDNLRRVWIDEQSELRNYLFATDTTTTSNADLPWKNSTTLPKLTQIRDNLHANYMAALFPNDRWLRWEAHTKDSNTKEKRKAIEAYIRTKIIDSNFRETVSRLVLDYIDYGNAIADVTYEAESKEDAESGQTLFGYVGPKARRISPLDIVFNPIAESFDRSPKITRSMVSIGELKLMMEESPEDETWVREALANTELLRKKAGGFSEADFQKNFAFQIDGFGSLSSYFESDLVEVLEFEGDAYDPDTQELLKDHVITVIDRLFIARKQPHPTWLRRQHKFHVGWRLRPDNLYAMGPMHNLVGMQYRIDHLENLKADVFDLIAFPPLKIIGEVNEFKWQPFEQIFVSEGGDVQMMNVNATALQADLQINLLATQMEEFAGAPKEALGIRSPGEKTAFEVSQLANAAGRIFQQKVTNFEINILEPLVNAMLEIGRRTIHGVEVSRIIDEEFGVSQFLDITPDDLTGQGKLRPVGARHFASQAQTTQTLVGLMNSPLGAILAPHINSKKLTAFIEDTLGLERFELFATNVAVYERIERLKLEQVGVQQLSLQDLMADDIDQITENVVAAEAEFVEANAAAATAEAESPAAIPAGPPQGAPQGPPQGLV